MGKHNYLISRLATAMLSVASSIFWQCSAKAAVEVVSVQESAGLLNSTDREVGITQFNPSLGSLQSVTIDVRGAGAFVQPFNHSGGGDRQLSGVRDLHLVLENSNGEALVRLGQAHPFPTSGHSSGSGLDGNSGSRIQRVTIAGQETLTSQEALMQFTGCGLADLFLSARNEPGEQFLFGHNLLTGMWVMGENIKVTYYYSLVAVPEPSTLIAGVFAVLTLVLVVGCSRARECARDS